MHRVKLTAEIMCSCTDFACSLASCMQIGDRLNKINSTTFFSLTVASTAVARDVSCVVLLVRQC